MGGLPQNATHSRQYYRRKKRKSIKYKISRIMTESRPAEGLSRKCRGGQPLPPPKRAHAKERDEPKRKTKKSQPPPKIPTATQKHTCASHFFFFFFFFLPHVGAPADQPWSPSAFSPRLLLRLRPTGIPCVNALFPVLWHLPERRAYNGERVAVDETLREIKPRKKKKKKILEARRSKKKKKPAK